MPIQMPPSPMDWEEGMNKNNSPDYLQFKSQPGKDVVIPGPSDPWGASEIIGTRTNQLSRKEATGQKGSISGMRKRLTSDTLDTQRRLKVAGKIIDIATRMAGEGAVDDEILRIASKLKAGLSESDVEEMHSQIARIASESGRVAFDETAIDDDGAQKQPEPTETENYVKIVRGPVDSSVQMSLKGKTDVRQPTASRRVADDQFGQDQGQFDPQQFGPSEEDDEFGDEDSHESFEDDDEFDDMNDEDGLDGDEDDDFSFGGDDDDDSVEDMNAGMPLSEIDMEDGMSEMNGLDDDQHGHEGEEGPEIVDEEEVQDDGEDLGSEENFIDDSGEVDELGDLSMIDEDGAFNSDDFLSEDDEEDDFSAGMGMGGGMSGDAFASLEDSQILASMGIETGAESAGVLSHRSLATHPSAGGTEMFRGRQARRRQVNIAERGEFSVWETENDPEIVAERMKGNRRRAAKQPQARQQQPVRRAAAPKPRPSQSRQAKRRQVAPQQQQFRPSRVRTSSRRPEASQNVFDQMFSVPNVDKFFEH